MSTSTSRKHRKASHEKETPKSKLAERPREKHTSSSERRRSVASKHGEPAIEPTKKRTEKHGLFPLNSPKEHRYNVIAVHGLGGDAFATWTSSDGDMWLRDSLPNDLLGCKIWTYGYDSAIAWSSSVQGLKEFAQDFLERLLFITVSRQGLHIPCVFICHSLGGIVIKKAITLAETLPSYKRLVPDFKAVVFMGTPHRGSRISSYATPLSRIVNGIIPANAIRADLLGKLKVLSQELAEISEMAIHRLSEMHVISFYEQKRTKGINCLVVEPASAILGIVNERAIPMNANHRELVRFSHTEPEKYRPLKNRLRDLVDKIEGDALDNPLRRKYMSNLYCVDYEIMLAESTQPYPGTGVWLFESDDFCTWAKQSTSGICWLWGHAGFGKSVIARAVVETLKARTALVSAVSPLGKSIVVHYFFRDEKMETLSELSFLRSILHQLVLEFPQILTAIDLVRASYSRNKRDHEENFRIAPNWMWNALETVLGMEVLKNAVLIIDALDELLDRDLVSILDTLIGIVRSQNESHKSHRLKVIIFSRPRSSITKALTRGRAQDIKIEIGQEETRRDLETYIFSAVEEYGKENSFPKDIIARIQSHILSGADGMFLWAHLAWEHFKQGVKIWTRRNINKQLSTLGSLPHGLEELYRKLFHYMDDDAKDQLNQVFMFICAAARPLGCDELGEMLSFEGGDPLEKDIPFDIEKALQDHCSNLFRINLEGSVQFVHLSLKEYLLKQLLKVDISFVHQHILRHCFSYLNSHSFKRDVVEDRGDWARPARKGCILHRQYVLYNYYAAYLTYHLEQIPQDDYIWIEYSKIMRDRDVFHAVTWTRHKDHVLHVPPPLYVGLTPLRHALRIRSLHLVTKFVESGYDIDEEAAVPEPGSNKNMGYYVIGEATTALHSYVCDPEVVALLLQHGANPNVRDFLKRTALHAAILYQGTFAVKALLALSNIDVNAEDFKGETPLHYQSAMGVLPTLIFDKRVDVSKVNGNGLSAMALSAFWGDESVFNGFVDGQDFDLSEYDEGFSPLICAAKQGWKGITCRMLEGVTDVNEHRGFDKKSIVHWAVINEWEDVLQTAVHCGNADVNAIDLSGKTGLHYAAQMGLFRMARQLLRYGASARIQDAAHRTAVHTAAVEGFADTLRPLILESDCDPQDVDAQNRSLVHWAASCDWAFLMMTVLEMPSIETTKRDHHGRTACHIAALCGCPNVLKVFVGLDLFDASEVDAYGNTCLHLAARGQSMTAVNLLLRYYDIQKHRVNCWGQTALDVALVYAATEIADILVEAQVRRRAAHDPHDVESGCTAGQSVDEYEQTPDHLSLVQRQTVVKNRKPKHDREVRTPVIPY